MKAAHSVAMTVFLLVVHSAERSAALMDDSMDVYLAVMWVVWWDVLLVSSTAATKAVHSAAGRAAHLVEWKAVLRAATRASTLELLGET